MCFFWGGEKNNNTNMYVWFIFGLVYSRGHYINYPLFLGGGDETVQICGKFDAFPF